MGFEWFRVDSSLVDHPKTARLAIETGNPDAVAFVVRLWAFFSRFEQHGTFDKKLAPHVEDACKWRGAPGGLVAALVACEWLDFDTKTDTFSARNWWEKQGAQVEKANRDAELKRQMRRENGARRNSAETAPKKRRPPPPARKRRAPK